MSFQFEWDEAKAEYNIAAHGVTFEEAATVFYDPLSLTIYDELHSTYEDRHIDIGSSTQGRLLVVVYTEREDRIRIISARLANVRERKQYEQ